MRRFGTPPQRGIHYIDRPGAYAIIPSQAGLLMTFQDEPKPEIQLPGGGLDPGEGPLEALYREVREETGWSLSLKRKLGVYQRYTFMPEYDLWARKICHIYLCAPRLHLGPPSEPGHTVLFLNPEAAIEALVSEGDRWFTARVFGL